MKKNIIKIKTIIFSFLLSTVLLGCINESQSTEQIGKDQGFRLEFLFEKDGVKVYRFWDGGRAHYFTTQGETISTQIEGKSYRQETIGPRNPKAIASEF